MICLFGCKNEQRAVSAEHLAAWHREAAAKAKKREAGARRYAMKERELRLAVEAHLDTLVKSLRADNEEMSVDLSEMHDQLRDAHSEISQYETRAAFFEREYKKLVSIHDAVEPEPGADEALEMHDKAKRIRQNIRSVPGTGDILIRNAEDVECYIQRIARRLGVPEEKL